MSKNYFNKKFNLLDELPIIISYQNSNNDFYEYLQVSHPIKKVRSDDHAPTKSINKRKRTKY
jgi:hypothetical protein